MTDDLAGDIPDDRARKLRPLLEQARESLDAAIECASIDVDAALDDMLAARLLLTAALLADGHDCGH